MLDRQSLADVLFTIVVVVALWVWNASAYIAITAAALCYLSIASIRALAGSETMRDVLVHRQAQVTERRRIAVLREQHLLVGSLQPPSALPADPQPQALPPRFVPAVDPRTRAAAIEWVWGLYGNDNRLDPNRVLGPHTKKPGQIQAPKPRADVLDLLTDERVGLVRVGEGGMLFWSASPTLTIHEASNRIQGRGASREG